MLSVKGQKQAFPKHFHNTYCISLINKGIECVSFDNKNIISEAGFFSITNPKEIHANPLLKSEVLLDFDTLYVSQKLMNDLSKINNLHFEKRSFKDDDLRDVFIRIKENLIEKKSSEIAEYLQEFIGKITQYSFQKIPKNEFCFNKKWNLVFDFIEQNYLNKILIEDIASIVNMSKYNFAKTFKNTTGMSPINYILMKRVFLSKEEIKKQTKLTDLCYKYNFSDMAHFSKTFKRFIGVSPKQYQKTI